MSHQIQVTIEQIHPSQHGTNASSGKAWMKQSFVGKTRDTQYPKTICFEAFKLDILDGLQVGSEAIVHFNVESREHGGKYYHNVNAWKVEAVAGQLPASQQAYPPNPFPPVFDQNAPDDLPF